MIDMSPAAIWHQQPRTPIQDGRAVSALWNEIGDLPVVERAPLERDFNFKLGELKEAKSDLQPGEISLALTSAMTVLMATVARNQTEGGLHGILGWFREPPDDEHGLRDQLKGQIAGDIENNFSAQERRLPHGVYVGEVVDCALYAIVKWYERRITVERTTPGKSVLGTPTAPQVVMRGQPIRG